MSWAVFKVNNLFEHTIKEDVKGLVFLQEKVLKRIIFCLCDFMCNKELHHECTMMTNSALMTRTTNDDIENNITLKLIQHTKYFQLTCL